MSRWTHHLASIETSTADTCCGFSCAENRKTGSVKKLKYNARVLQQAFSFNLNSKIMLEVYLQPCSERSKQGLKQPHITLADTRGKDRATAGWASLESLHTTYTFTSCVTEDGDGEITLFATRGPRGWNWRWQLPIFMCYSLWVIPEEASRLCKHRER